MLCHTCSMRQWMVGLAALLAGCSATSRCLIPRTHTGRYTESLETECGLPYHWAERDFPVIVRVEDDLPDSYYLRVEEGVNLWNSFVGREFLVLASEEFSSGSPRHPREIRISQDELGLNPETGTRELGFARSTVDLNTGEIQSSVIKLDLNLEGNIILTVVIHELGHAIGLRHDDTDPGSTMFPLIWDPTIQRLRDVDLRVVLEGLPSRLARAEPVPQSWQVPLPLIMMPPGLACYQ